MNGRKGFCTDQAVEGSSGAPEDRVDARQSADGRNGVLMVVADGAGGLPGGAEAAERVRSRARSLSVDRVAAFGPRDWRNLLSELDRRVRSEREAGQTTAIRWDYFDCTGAVW